jgi:hypothetical protein
MKKIILLTTGIVLFSCSTEEIIDDQNLIDEIESLANNEDDEYQNLSDTDLSLSVQKKITDYINENHSGKTITEVEIENQIIEIELSGNTELSFTLSGDYLSTEVDVEDDNDDDNYSDDDENEYISLSSSSLSEAVQQKIEEYINDNYPNDTVTEVEIENQKIEVELSSDIELIFDLNGNFLRLDD